MHAKALKIMILNALGGGAIAAAGCGNDRNARVEDAAPGEGDQDSGPRAAAAGGKGGKGGQGGSGATGGQLASNCYRTPGVGTCCRDEHCVPRRANDELDASSDDADGGKDLPACQQTLPRAGVCTWYSDLQSFTDDRCCYIRTSGSCCGRPFFVGSEARAAELCASADWAGDYPDTQLALDPVTRAELASAWLTDASLEHASIASFARFTLQALALGAPADLLAAAQRAGLDEVSHARLCFALANRYTETPVGPGAFAMDGVLGSCTLAEAAAASVREGCVGETLAALQARLQLEYAEDPDVRMALQRIADDEARHAELAWRFTRWALQQGDESVRVAVQDAFRESLTRLHTEALRAQPAVDVAAWHAHGRLTASEERACWLDAAREVIEPCLRTLFRA